MKAYKETEIKQVLNINIVGSLTISDNVVSGFNANNYATAGELFNPSINNWEIGFKITTGNDVSGAQQVIYESNRGFGSGSMFSPIRLAISRGNFSICISNVLTNEASLTGTTAISVNATYYTKLIFDGTSYKLYISTDGITYTEEINFISSTTVYQGLNFLIGRHSNVSGDYQFLGSIDFNQSYININGERWWDGTIDKPFDIYKLPKLNETYYGIGD